MCISALPGETFSYDLNGNRTSVTTGTANRALTDGTFDYSYDEEGNLTQKRQLSNGEVTDYLYDHRNRLTSVTRKSSTGTVLSTSSYGYDVNNRRIRKTVNGVTTYSLYNDEDTWADYDSGLNITARYFYGEQNLFSSPPLSGTLQCMKPQREKVLLPPLKPWEVLTLLIPILLYLFIRLRSTMEPGDDAYMTLRFVTNLLAGNGYVYNPGERVLGTTALYPSLLAFVCKIFGSDPLTTGKYFLLPFELGDLAIIWMIGRRISSSAVVGMVAATLFATSGYLLYSTLIYMEAPLFAFLILSACVAFDKLDDSRWRAASWLLAGLATICRPEGGILFVVFFLILLLTGKGIRKSDFGWIALATLPWLVFATWYFGSPIPTSMTAKRLGYLPFPNQAARGLIQQIEELLNLIPYQTLTARWLSVLINFSLLGFGALLVIAASERIAALLFFTFTFWILYVVANPFIFPWYLVPLEAPFYIAISCALYRLAGTITGSLGARSSLIQTLIFLSLVLPTLGGRAVMHGSNVCRFSAGTPSCEHRALTYPLPDLSPRAGLSFGREGWYKEVTEDLKGQVNASTTILTPEFGVFGYYLPAKMISSVGHVNREVFPFLPPPLSEVDYPAINNAVTVEMVDAFQPDYVIAPEVFIRKSLLQSDWFKGNYSTEKIYPFGVYNYGRLYVFRRIFAHTKDIQAIDDVPS